jgi:hypothetical protein
MLDTNHCKDYYDATVTWAREHGMFEGDDPDAQFLKRRLDYLDKYADHEGKGLTKCILSKDFAPHSFEFTMMRRITDLEKQRELAARGVNPEHGVFWEYWFNGGLIFHGAHDNGGNGGAPTFAVSLVPCHGWSIHT